MKYLLFFILFFSKVAGTSTAPLTPKVITVGERFVPHCDSVESGVDDNNDGILTKDEIIVTIILCDGRAPYVWTKGK